MCAAAGGGRKGPEPARPKKQCTKRLQHPHTCTHMHEHVHACTRKLTRECSRTHTPKGRVRKKSHATGHRSRSATVPGPRRPIPDSLNLAALAKLAPGGAPGGPTPPAAHAPIEKNKCLSAGGRPLEALARHGSARSLLELPWLCLRPRRRLAWLCCHLLCSAPPGATQQSPEAVQGAELQRRGLHRAALLLVRRSAKRRGHAAAAKMSPSPWLQLERVALPPQIAHPGLRLLKAKAHTVTAMVTSGNRR